MRKLVVLGMGVCLVLAFASCKSSESAYKKAYEKAKQQELAEPQVEAPVEVTPLNDEKLYIVRSGLDAGETIVAEGVGLLQDGMDITVKQ